MNVLPNTSSSVVDLLVVKNDEKIKEKFAQLYRKLLVVFKKLESNVSDKDWIMILLLGWVALSLARMLNMEWEDEEGRALTYYYSLVMDDLMEILSGFVSDSPRLMELAESCFEEVEEVVESWIS